MSPPDLHAARRTRLIEHIGDGVAIIPANPELNSSRDTDVPYRPNSDLYYLTGFAEPGSVAVIDAKAFTLFVRPREPDREVWTGPRAGVEGAALATGAVCHPIGEFDSRFPELVATASRIWYPVGHDPNLDGLVREALVRGRYKRQRSGSGPYAMLDLEEATGPLRLIKAPEELEAMRAAARIAAAGHAAAKEAAKPGVGEWEVQAALEHTFRSMGADGPAFPSIVGSGPNATTLHYTANDRTIRDGDLVLVDAGAAYRLYASDCTRTWPASGRFSDEQARIYDLVLAAERAAIALARPGGTVQQMHEAALKILSEGVASLGLPGDEIRHYYMHQTSHWLGLDVHDTGSYQGELLPGMVLTVEPGLYLRPDDESVPEPYRGIGVRIEDTVIVTAGDPEVITADAPLATTSRFD